MLVQGSSPGDVTFLVVHLAGNRFQPDRPERTDRSGWPNRVCTADPTLESSHQQPPSSPPPPPRRNAQSRVIRLIFNDASSGNAGLFHSRNYVGRVPRAAPLYGERQIRGMDGESVAQSSADLRIGRPLRRVRMDTAAWRLISS